MHRELLILRHAKSDWNVDCSDFDRPLNSRGEKNAKTMGLWLKQQGIIPDLILSSPAKRAKSMVKLLCKFIGLTESIVEYNRRIYGSDIKTLKKILATCSNESNCVLLVGHNPELEMLLIYLTGGLIEFPIDGKLLATATLARLQMPDDWNTLDEACAKVLSITRASQIAAA